MRVGSKWVLERTTSFFGVLKPADGSSYRKPAFTPMCAEPSHPGENPAREASEE